MLICLPISNKTKGTKGNESAREMENVFIGRLYRLELYVREFQFHCFGCRLIQLI